MHVEFQSEDQISEERQGRAIVLIAVGATLLTVFILAYGLFFLG